MTTSGGAASGENAGAAAGPRRRMRPWLIFIGLIGLYFAVVAYPPLRVASVMAPQWQPSNVWLLVLLCGPAVGWLVHQSWRNSLTRGLLRLAYTWVGAGFIAAVVVGVWDLTRLVLALFERPIGPGMMVTLLTAAIGYALMNAHRLVVRRLFIDSDKLSEPLRVVQITDVHLGSRTGAFLTRVVRRINRLRPDVVLITGDLVDLKALPASIYAGLAALEAPSYFVIGNHERYIGADEVCAALTRLGVSVLRNRAVEHGELRLVGIDDAESREQVATHLGPAMAGNDPSDHYNVLLYHRPDGFEAAAEAGIDLMLCGHTHNGQIYPFNYVVRRVFARLCGRYQLDDAVLYVSPGTGTWGPLMRLGSVNEVTVIELRPA